MMIPGVDLSNWQPNYNWPAARHSGIRFAYLKASEGESFVDKMYSAHRRNANMQDIVIGAYHFARPSAGSAQRQAEHFLKCASLRRGDLIPALDLEVSGGLSPAHLVFWVTQFRDEVRRQIGHAPVIYTSPSFWASAMAGSRAFADCPLWIAHWGVASPTIPKCWTTWTVWQWQGSPLDRDRAKALPIYQAKVTTPAKPGPVHTVRMSANIFRQFAAWYRRLTQRRKG